MIRRTLLDLIGSLIVSTGRLAASLLTKILVGLVVSGRAVLSAGHTLLHRRAKLGPPSPWRQLAGERLTERVVLAASPFSPIADVAVARDEAGVLLDQNGQRLDLRRYFLNGDDDPGSEVSFDYGWGQHAKPNASGFEHVPLLGRWGTDGISRPGSVQRLNNPLHGDDNGAWRVLLDLDPVDNGRDARLEQDAEIIFQFGRWEWGDVPVAGDFDGDGRTDIAMASPTGDPVPGVGLRVLQWHVVYAKDFPDPVDQLNPPGPFPTFSFADPRVHDLGVYGFEGDLPIAGNFDANSQGAARRGIVSQQASPDGRYQLYLETRSVPHVVGHAGPQPIIIDAFGIPSYGSGDKLVFGNFSGTRQTGVAVVSETPGKVSTWHVDVDLNGTTDETFLYGLPGDHYLAGQFTVPAVRINDVTIVEGDTGSRQAVFTVQLVRPSFPDSAHETVVPVSIDFATRDVTASAAAGDYSNRSGQLTFQPLETTKTISINIRGDDLAEGTERFLIELSSPSNATIFDGSAVGTIVDDDFRPVANAGGPYVIDEGDSLRLDAGATTDVDSTSLTYRWDVNGDGSFDENVHGVSPTLTWLELVALGIDDGPDQHTLTVEASDGTNHDTATAPLQVRNKRPTIAVNHDRVQLNEGNIAVNSGTFSDPGDDTVTLSASVGSVNANSDGTWSWTCPVDDGPDDSGVVTITATDSDGAVSSVTFELVVDNLAPHLTVDHAKVQLNEDNIAVNSGTVSDPGDDTVTLSASVGSVNANSDGTWSWTYPVDDGPDDSGVVTITATDSDGAVSSVTFELVVDNLAPHLTVDHAKVQLNEDNIAVNSGTVSDPGDDTVTLSASVGSVTANSNGTWSWTYPVDDGPDDSGVVTITATDSDGAASSVAFELVVDNLAPHLTVDHAKVQLNEGNIAVNSGTFSDPGDDTVTLSASVGSVSANSNGTWSWTYPVDDGPDDSGVVTITATDSDGATSSVAFELVVDNLAPHLTVDHAKVQLNEGNIAVNSGTFSDPGDDSVTLSASVGSVTANSNGSWSWTYPVDDGPDDSGVVTITATDSDGAASSVTFELVVDNLAPHLTVDHAKVQLNEGNIAVNSGTFSDPGDDTVTLSASVGSVSANSNGTWSWTYPVDDGPDDSGVVTITATDSDGAASSVTFELVVDNLAPHLTVDHAKVQLNEDNIAVNSGTVSDPGDDTVTLSASVGSVSANSNGTWSWTYPVDDGPDDSGVVTITATDSDGAVSSVAFELVVDNLAPHLTVDHAKVQLNEGNIAVNSGTFSDPGDDSVTLSASVGSVTANSNGSWSWTYPVDDGPDDSGVVTITATDSDGAASSVTFELVVDNLAPHLTVDHAKVQLNEGNIAVNGGTFSDPGDDSVTLSASVGSVTANSNGSWSWTYPVDDGPDDSGVVTITATDSDGAASSVTFELVVDNLAPHLTVDHAKVQLNEGNIAVNGGTFSDPGDDTVTLSASVGSVSADSNGTWSWTYPVDDGPDDSGVVTITATDSDGAVSSVAFELVVDNLAPHLTVDHAKVQLNEGNIAVNGGTFSDPGDDTVTLSASVGSVSANSDGTWSWTYPVDDGPDDSGVVTITATDSDGAAGSVTFELVVDNVAPRLTFDQDHVRVDEGGVATNTGSVFDPGQDDVTLTASVGSIDLFGGGNWAWSWADAQPGETTVVITAIDSDGAVSSSSFRLSVVSVRVHLTATDTTGAPLSVVAAGGSFVLRAFVEQLGPDPQGAFSFYTDVAWDANRASVAGDLQFSGNYPNGRSGDATTAGLIDEAGGIADFTPLGGGLIEVFSVTLQAGLPGRLVLQSDPADVLPAHEVILFGATQATPLEAIEFGSVDLDVVVGSAPVAVSDRYEVDEDMALVTDAATGVLANDLDQDGDALSAVVAETTANGQLVLNGDGSFVYMPDANFVGEDSFSYRASDGHLLSSPVTVSIQVLASNDRPIAEDDGPYEVTIGGRLELGPVEGLLSNDRDVEGDPLTAELVMAPEHGELHLAPDGSFVFVAEPGFQGTDRFTYLASDGMENSEPATVTIEMVAPGIFLTLEATDFDGTPIDVVGLDSSFLLNVFVEDRRPDPTGVHSAYLDVFIDFARLMIDGPLSYGDLYPNAQSGVSMDVMIDEGGASTSRLIPIGAGKYLLFSVPLQATALGTATFFTDPSELFVRPVLVFGEDEAVAISNVSYGSGSINIVPPLVSNDDHFTIEEDAPATQLDVLRNDAAVSSPPITIVETGPTDNGGQVSIAADGQSVLYKPAANHFGPDGFTYTVTDSQGHRASAFVAMTITEINDPPTASDDEGEALSGHEAIVLDVLKNDTIFPDKGESLTIVGVTVPDQGGNVEIGPDGLSLVYTPPTRFAGSETFQYTIDDGRGGTDTATVTMHVALSWHNGYDVNDDGYVAPFDVLLVINALNELGPRRLPTPTADFSPPPFLDVNDDGFVSPHDALAIINFLNAMPAGEGEGARPQPVPERVDLQGQRNAHAFLSARAISGGTETEGESFANNQIELRSRKPELDDKFHWDRNDLERTLALKETFDLEEALDLIADDLDNRAGGVSDLAP